MTQPTTVAWSQLRKAADDATKPIPKDWYDVTIDKMEFKYASTGSPMLVTQLVVDSGPFQSRRLFTNYVLSTENGFAMGIFFASMEALGFGPDFFQELETRGVGVEAGLSLIAQQAPGRQLRVEVDTRTWQGQERNEIKQTRPRVGGGPVAPGVSNGPVTPGFGGPIAPGFGGPVAPGSPASVPSGSAAPTPAVSPATSSPATAPPVSSTPPAPMTAPVAPPSVASEPADVPPPPVPPAF